MARNGASGEEPAPLSQIANEAFNPVAPRPEDLGPMTFRGLVPTGGRAAGGPIASPRAQAGAQPRHPGSARGEVYSQHEDSSLHLMSTPMELKPRAGRHGKLFNDPIHGAFRLDPACTDLIDSRGFQRLRRLKQLGCTYYVFPGASHNRFEHSLGVAHLAYRFASQIWNLQGAELELERRDLRCVELAGLCHDLGHGPFSHVFDRGFLRMRGITDWSHEEMSSRMLDHIIDDNHVDTIAADDLATVKHMINAAEVAKAAGPSPGPVPATAFGSSFAAGLVSPLGASPPGTASAPSPVALGKRWLTEIVANGRNSIDVDKFDYLQRDGLHCGVKLAVDPQRLMQFSKVIDDEICYRWSEYFALHEVFHARALMHRIVYTHRKARAVESMVVDALLEADQALGISERIWRAEDLVGLDDGILDWLEYGTKFGPWGRRVGTSRPGPTTSASPGDGEASEGPHTPSGEGCESSGAEHRRDGAEGSLRAAAAIVDRLRRRDLYRFCGEALVPPEMLIGGNFRSPTAADVVNSYRGSGPRLRPEDVIVQENTISFSMKDRNPLDHVHFFDHLESTEKRSLRPEQISNMMASSFQDSTLRVYSRRSDAAAVAAVSDAFASWLRGSFGGSCASVSPVKPRGHVGQARAGGEAGEIAIFDVRGSSPPAPALRQAKRARAESAAE